MAVPHQPVRFAAPVSAIREELDRVLASPEFLHADRMSTLLRYLVEQVLEGESNHLKEVIVGVQVFGRDPGYDPKQDPVVRVSAGRLRRRLADFYQRAGGCGVRIAIPKGSYVPEFVPL